MPFSINSLVTNTNVNDYKKEKSPQNLVPSAKFVKLYVFMVVSYTYLKNQYAIFIINQLMALKILSNVTIKKSILPNPYRTQLNHYFYQAIKNIP